MRSSGLVVPTQAFYVELHVRTLGTTFPLPMCVCLFVYVVASKSTKKNIKLESMFFLNFDNTILQSFLILFSFPKIIL